MTTLTAPKGLSARAAPAADEDQVHLPPRAAKYGPMKEPD